MATHAKPSLSASIRITVARVAECVYEGILVIPVWLLLFVIALHILLLFTCECPPAILPI